MPDLGAATLTFFGLTFAFPWALVGLLALAVVIRPAPRIRWLRALTLLLLVVALAQPWVSVSGGHLALVVDVSDSVAERGLEAARGLDLGQLAAGSEVVLAAADAVRSPALAAPAPPTLATDATDLARALQVAVANGASRIVLLSDGVTPPSSLLTALPPVPVDVLHVPSIDTLRLQQLLLPAQAAPEQVVQGVAVIAAGAGGPAQLHIEAAGVALPPLQLDLPPGSTAVPFEFRVGASGSTAVLATLLPATQPPTGSSSASGAVLVRSRPPVLVIGDPAVAQLLTVQGIEVQVGDSSDLVAPLPFSAVVVRGSSAQFTAGQLDLLRSYVEGGGGLLMTGGPESFGFGAWYRTPVEEVLPVTTDLRTEVSLPLVALVMVIDVSGSMSSGRPPKIELAKEGALQVVELAYQEDLLGLVAFSDGSGTRWVFDLRQATERGKREMAQGILQLGTGGGTVLEPAYRMALDALASSPAAVKHVIVLSDGQLSDGATPFGQQASTPVDFQGIAADALARGITTSTIAIGEAADFTRLSQIARAGGGRYYAALDASTLPRIFTDEALTATRALLVDEPTAPTPHPNPLYSFPPALPKVDAYVATSLKDDAQELLGARQDEPLLATRRAGLGRSAALTTDLNGWAGPFGDWPDLPGAMATLARWLQARPPGWSATAERAGPDVLVTLDAVEAGAYVNNARIEARYAGLTMNLEQTAPGRYQARLPWRSAAGQVVLVSGGEVVARAQVTGPDPEYADMDGAALLADVAQRSGGRVLVPGQAYSADLAGGRRQLWAYFAVTALALFILELWWRRRLA